MIYVYMSNSSVHVLVFHIGFHRILVSLKWFKHIPSDWDTYDLPQAELDDGSQGQAIGDERTTNLKLRHQELEERSQGHALGDKWRRAW